MSKLSLIEKLGILFKTSMSSKLPLIFLVLLIIVGIFLFKTNKKNEKMNKIIYSVITISILLFVIVTYHESIGKMITYMMNNFFIVAFFPNLAIYMAALIATNIIVWISIFSYKSSKQIKLLNIIVYIIFNYLFALILSTVKTSNLDIFSQTSVYANETASALISLSSTVFIIWVIFLVIYKILLTYIRKDYKPKVKKVIVRRKVKKLPENFIPLDNPKYIYGNAPKNNKVIIEKVEEEKQQENQEEISKIGNLFTLEDYKLLLKMLNEQKAKEKEEKKIIKEENTLDIIKENDYDLDDFFDDEIKEEKIVEQKTIEPKIEIQEDEQRELKKYNELLELYGMH